MSTAKPAKLMRVTEIDISDLHFSRAKHQHCSYVSMTITRDDAPLPIHVQFLCHAEQPEECLPSIVTQDLIKDALRQAHRMPGFRRGERRIEVNISASSITGSITGPARPA